MVPKVTTEEEEEERKGQSRGDDEWIYNNEIHLLLLSGRSINLDEESTGGAATINWRSQTALSADQFLAIIDKK